MKIQLLTCLAVLALSSCARPVLPAEAPPPLPCLPVARSAVQMPQAVRVENAAAEPRRIYVETCPHAHILLGDVAAQATRVLPLPGELVLIDDSIRLHVFRVDPPAYRLVRVPLTGEAIVAALLPQTLHDMVPTTGFMAAGPPVRLDSLEVAVLRAALDALHEPGATDFFRLPALLDRRLLDPGVAWSDQWSAHNSGIDGRLILLGPSFDELTARFADVRPCPPTTNMECIPADDTASIVSLSQPLFSRDRRRAEVRFAIRPARVATPGVAQLEGILVVLEARPDSRHPWRVVETRVEWVT